MIFLIETSKKLISEPKKSFEGTFVPKDVIDLLDDGTMPLDEVLEKACKTLGLFGEREEGEDVKREVYLSDEEPEPNSLDERRKRTGDEGMKSAAMLQSFLSVFNFKCGPECAKKFGGTGHCVQNVSSAGCFDNVVTLKYELWGKSCDPSPTSSQRKFRLWDIQKRMHNESTNAFDYFFLSRVKSARPVFVCESSFVFLLGFLGKRKTRQFIKNKMLIQRGFDKRDPRLNALKVDRIGYRLEQAKSFISWFRDENCDVLPVNERRNSSSCGCGSDDEFSDDDENQETAAESTDVYVLPYDNISDFYGEYVMHCADYNKPCCCESTFRRALNSAEFKSSLRMMR